MKKLISVVTPCYNEESNIEDIFLTVKKVFSNLNYRYEHIFIDNGSTDKSVEELKKLAATHSEVKIIVNNRNFGAIRSSFHGLLQASGDAVINIAADFQDPPEMIKDFLQFWEEGNPVVVAIKEESEVTGLMFPLRKLYYKILDKLSEVPIIQNFTGFGLYDKKVMDTIRSLKDPNPYFRGIISDLGYPVKKVFFKQPRRKRGITSTNFYWLYNFAMLGITSHSKVPLRVATMSGFFFSLLSFFAGMVYLFYKLIAWNSFSVGMAPVLLGVFFFSSIILFFIGILGEYIGVIHTQVLNRPLIIEKERINFENDFKTEVQRIFDQVKCKDPRDLLINIPVRDELGQTIAFLTPITKDFRRLTPLLPELLTRWRNDNPTLSTGKFVATPERTAKWLDELVINRADRLIFMINSLTGVPWGHIGFSNFDYANHSGELDSVLKAVSDAPRSLMKYASLSLIQWGYSVVKMKDITLSVYSDNLPAITFYQKLGFTKTRLHPLIKVLTQDVSGGQEERLELAPLDYDGPAEKYYLYMKYQQPTISAAPL